MKPIINYNTPEEIEILADKIIEKANEKKCSVAYMVRGLVLTALLRQRMDAAESLDEAIEVLVTRGVLQRGETT